MNEYLNAFRQYATFTGRARRREYWMFALFNAVIIFVLAILAGMLSPNMDQTGPSLNLGTALYGLYTLAVFIPSLAVTARRLHDTGRSGWWQLINLVPFVGSIILLIFAVQDSQPGSNRWGTNPKGQGAAAATW